ncbi:MAG: hypothetical protein U0271_07030 [Polyangiaceae bacterium]
MRASVGLAVGITTSLAVALASEDAHADSAINITPLARTSLGERLSVNDDPLADLGFTGEQSLGVTLSYFEHGGGFGVNMSGQPEFVLAPNLGVSYGQAITAFQFGIGVGGGFGWLGVTYEPKLVAGTWDREDDELDEVPLVGMRNSIELNLLFGGLAVEVGHEVDYYRDDFHDSLVAFFRFDVGMVIPLILTGYMR